MSSTLLRNTNYKWWAFLAVSAGTFTSVVDHGTVIVALPTIADHFHTELPTLQWIVVGYGLTISALILPIGRLSDLVGRKRICVTGFVVFMLAAILAGFSTHVVALILARVLMGCGAAMTQSTGMAIAAALLVISKDRVQQDGPRPTFDGLGAALSAGALTTLLVGLTIGPRIGWTSPSMAFAAIGFPGFLGAFIWWELRTSDPMLDLRLFKRRVFAFGVSAGFISFLGTSSILFMMPLYLQSVLGYGPATVGLIMVPNALAMIIMGPLSGRLSDRYGWRKLNVGGLCLSATGILLLSRITETSPLGLVMAGMILQSSGLGMFNSPNTSSILSVVDQSKYGVVSALTQLIRNSATVTSIAVATAIVTATMASMGHPPSLQAVSEGASADVFRAFTSGLRTAYLVMGSLLLVGVVISFLKGGGSGEVVSPLMVGEVRVESSPANGGG